MGSSRVPALQACLVLGAAFLASCSDGGGGGSGPVANSPARIDSLQVIAAFTDSLTLSWRAPGLSNDSSASATSYDLRYATFTITGSNWDDAVEAVNEPAPGAPGTIELMGIGALVPGTQYFIAIRSANEDNQWSPLSNVATGSTSEEPQGAYVAANGNDDWPGSADSAKATIQSGIAAAVALGKPNVFVSKGIYEENVVLVDGVSVRGGYDAEDGWSRDISANTTVIMGSVAQGNALPVLARDIKLPTWVEGLTIQGVDVEGYVVVYIANSGGLVLSDCRIKAGNGQPGFSPPDSPDTENQYEGGVGGVGGPGGIPPYAFGSPGQPGEDGDLRCITGGGNGGSGAPGGSGSQNGPEGGPGGPGYQGQPGFPGVGRGWCLSEGLWFSRGHDGRDGQEGGCGGGGGGGGGSGSRCTPDSGCVLPGAAGGKGGRGGTGGIGGLGGDAGGSTFGIICVQSPCQIRNCLVEGGNGGLGGDGSGGGAGSTGENGVAGETTSFGTHGGRGGRGGTGGLGGPGGGGAGGSSWCVVVIGERPDLVENTYVPGSGGPGGGGPGLEGSTGASGDVNLDLADSPPPNIADCN